MFIINKIFDEIKSTHLRLVKLNCAKRQDSDYYFEISQLETKQKQLTNELKKRGWCFDYENIKLVKLNE